MEVLLLTCGPRFPDRARKGTITNPTTAATSVTGLTQGVYQFELRVTDNGGAFGRDTVQVTVNPAASNIPPVANAGVRSNDHLTNKLCYIIR